MGQRVTHVQLGSTNVLRAGGVRPAPAERRPEPNLADAKNKWKKSGKTQTPKPTALQKPRTRKPKKWKGATADPMAGGRKLRKTSAYRPATTECVCGWAGPAGRYELHKTWLGNLDREHGKVDA